MEINLNDYITVTATDHGYSALSRHAAREVEALTEAVPSLLRRDRKQFDQLCDHVASKIVPDRKTLKLRIQMYEFIELCGELARDPGARIDDVFSMCAEIDDTSQFR